MSKIDSKTQTWIAAAKTFRDIKASQSGFTDPGDRSDFIARGFAQLIRGLPQCKPCPELFKEIVSLGSVPLFDASITAHGVEAWKSQAPKSSFHYPAGAGNLAMLKRFEAYDFDLSGCVGKILITAAQMDNEDLLDWWVHMGFDQMTDWKVSLRKVIEPCGPSCAPKIHDLILRRMDSNSSFAGGAVFIEAIRQGRLKVATYLQACGVRHDTISDVWEVLGPDAGIFCEVIDKKLRSFTGSAHAEMAFRALEPDPIAVLGRPKHEAFIGISKETLMAAALSTGFSD